MIINSPQQTFGDNNNNNINDNDNQLVFFLNGEKVVIDRPNPELTVLQYVRSVGLTGTKLGCGEGGCGVCTIMVSRYTADGTISHKAVNACLYPLCALSGSAVTTIEGLGNVTDGLHPVQEKMSEGYGSQCGFCTPGIIMALYAYLRSHPHATRKQIEDSFDGNLCRCTGYRPILDAAKSFAVDDDQEQRIPPIANGGVVDDDSKQSICPSSGKPCNCKSKTSHIPSKPLDLKSEPIFPPFLMSYKNASQVFKGERVTWYSPITFNELLTLKKQHNNAKIVVGNTEIGIETKFRNLIYPVIICPTKVPELNQIKKNENGIEIGASVTLSEIKSFLHHLVKDESMEGKTETFKAILSQLKWFAGTQIRNAACLGGNLVTASPISDLNPVLLAAGAILTLVSINENNQAVYRKVHINQFFLKYRIVDIKPDEILESVFIPYTRPLEFVYAYKQSRRREDDIAIVSCCFRFFFEREDQVFKVKECTLAYGGMNIKAVTCPSAEQFLVGKIWNKDVLQETYKYLENDLPLAQGAPGGMIEYRRSLTTSFFFKFYLTVCKKLFEQSSIPEYQVSEKELSATDKYTRPASHAEQNYQSNPALHPVNMAVKHQSADKQVTGEAVYVDDIQIVSLHAAMVLASKAHAYIKSIDPSKALAYKGVKAFYCAKDIKGENKCGVVFKHDEEVFASKEVFFNGQPLGVVIADSLQTALEASKLVTVEYEDLPAILSIEDAIEKQSFIPVTHVINDGDIVKGFAESKHIITGQVKIGAQEHFYLETQGTLAVPGEGNEMTIYSSTQNPTKTQDIVASVLGTMVNQVVVRTKRMGGGFGGKESKSIIVSCIAALAASKLKKPVRLILDRDVDMITSGTRHPFIGKYKIGFNDQGLINAADIELFADAGFSIDLSIGVLDRAIFHSENAYKVPNIRVVGKLCKTNLPSNTAFRGFGGPQGMMVCENWIEKISQHLSVPSYKIRELNFYKEGELTHYLQKVENNHMLKLWNQMLEKSDYHKRVALVEKFNSDNRWKKRGIAIIPTKFGMSFTIKALNQAGALVHVYTDGSVLVTHGGTEMGQGLHTKMVQIAARALNVPLENVFIAETATDKVANTTPTAASVSSDMNGMAVLDACEQINARLEPLREKNPQLTFKQLVSLAHNERVNLSANGFYATPNVGYAFKESGVGDGVPFNYFNYGAACSEVEIDVLTGDFTTLRSDIILDVGDSLNPTIDIGQVEGAFIQGMGWSTMEEIVTFQPSGYQFTRGPSTYKIPGFNDIPIEFNVSLLSDSPNPKAIHSSKGVGEPPLFLGSSVYFAIREAISSSRKESNLVEWFDLPSPATCERIRNSCVDSFTLQFTAK
ncbi:hypothetical protein CYY_002524 [Polysphondylium violaceum]|uniref:xanthine dehydrogenase n=1 Tax=Polysphondylium violaceum TaxID=133409 RepID=A0A8J4UV23_9MYCE|nr:hypothetical protein CYY_002524 [Polysphondylium violaceum]